MDSTSASAHGISKYLDCATTSISSGKMMTIKPPPITSKADMMASAAVISAKFPISTIVQEQMSASTVHVTSHPSSLQSEEIRKSRGDHDAMETPTPIPVHAKFVASVKSVQEQIVSALAGSMPETSVRSLETANGEVRVDYGKNSDSVALVSSTSDAVTGQLPTSSSTDIPPGIELQQPTSFPFTPKRTDDTKGPASKTPTFAAESPRQKSKKPRNTRRRASTPHPNASSSSATDSNTTTPATTPEKVSKPRPRRGGTKQKNVDCTATPETGSAVSAEAVIVSRKSTRPRRRRAGRKIQKTPMKSVLNEADESTTAPETSLKVESPNPEVMDTAKPSSAPEAYTTDIQYPSFQTSEILDFGPEPQLPPQSSSATQDSEDKTEVSSEEAKQETTTKSKKPFRSRYRYRRLRLPTPISPKQLAEEGTRPYLESLFKEYGTEFTNTQRPCLQYAKLQLAALQKCPDIDLRDLRNEFHTSYQIDTEKAWPGQEIVMSPIDDYFMKRDLRIRDFVYDPTRDAADEFHRLSLVAKWIDGPMKWDLKNWDASLDRFGKLWSSSLAKEERREFKNACFQEFDQLLGHIFFDTVGQDPNYGAKQPSSGTQTSPETSKTWELTDYHRFLAAFDEPPRPTVRECKDVIRENLNVNLYDLLNWFRNPDHATRPVRFPSAEALGEYSYVENKVFSLDTARVSRFAKPLLRKIAQFKNRRPFRHYPARQPVRISKPSNSDSETDLVNENTPPSGKSSDSIALESIIATSTKSTDTASVSTKGVSLFDVPAAAVQTLSVEAPAHPPRKKRSLPQRSVDPIIEAPVGQTTGLTT